MQHSDLKNEPNTILYKANIVMHIMHIENFISLFIFLNSIILNFDITRLLNPDILFEITKLLILPQARMIRGKRWLLRISCIF